jgi:hypothetical protein
VVTAFNQVGGALGLAIVSTLSTSKANAEAAAGSSPTDALVAGFHRGLLVAAGFMLLALATTLVAPRLSPAAEQIADAAVA